MTARTAALALALAAAACARPPAAPERRDGLARPTLLPYADQTATLLLDGRVMLVGGRQASAPVARARAFDPRTETWEELPPMSAPRAEHAATLLADGHVMVSGGVDATGAARLDVEIFHCDEYEWTPGAPMSAPRRGHTSTRINDGRVVIVGGSEAAIESIDIQSYDPSSGRSINSATTPSLPARRYHTSTLLPGDRLLVVGGGGPAGSPLLLDIGGVSPLSNGPSADRYDHTATLLPNGTVVVAGGRSSGATLDSVELFQPDAGSWQRDPWRLREPRYGHTAVVLPDGRLAIHGGTRDGVTPLSSIELWSQDGGSVTVSQLETPRAGHSATLLPGGRLALTGGAVRELDVVEPGPSFSASAGPPLLSARRGHTLTMLPSGDAVIVGGSSAGDAVEPVEVVTRAGGAPSQVGWLQREAHATVLDGRGKILVVGGRDGARALATVPVLAPSGLEASAPPLSVPREGAAAVYLPAGDTLVIGGWTTGRVPLASAELWAPTGSTGAVALSTPRAQPAATLLSTGAVLVSGGTDGSELLASAEVFERWGTPPWRVTSPMRTGRIGHTLTLLPDGKVIAIGGRAPGGAPLELCEVFDPRSGTWRAGPRLSFARSAHTASLLAGGRVLVSGGFGPGGAALAQAELVDERGAVALGALGEPRGDHAAAVFADGRVLLTGGAAQLAGPPIGTTTWVSPSRLAAVSLFGGALTAYTREPLDFGAWRAAFVTEGSGGNARGSPTHHPLFELARHGNDHLVMGDLGRTTFTATSGLIYLPPRTQPGPHWLRAIAGGVTVGAYFVDVIQTSPSPVGSACGAGSDCTSGFCADGVCCNAACDQACQVCARALGAQHDGFCSIAEGLVCNPSRGGCDPAELCRVDSGPTCPQDALAPAGTLCAPVAGCLVAATCAGASPTCPAAHDTSACVGDTRTAVAVGCLELLELPLGGYPGAQLLEGPEGMRLDEDHVLRWTPRATQGGVTTAVVQRAAGEALHLEVSVACEAIRFEACGCGGGGAASVPALIAAALLLLRARRSRSASARGPGARSRFAR